MTQRAIVIAWLALGLVAGCAETTPPEISSGSNWLTCESVDDCDDGRAVRCSEDGYCLDVEGGRIAAPAQTSASSRDAGSTPMSGPSDDDGIGPSVTTDSGTPAVGESPGQATGADASVVQTSFGGLARCELPGAREPLVPRADETCWDFAAHGISSTTDTTPFPIPPSESYNQFYYPVPWEAGSVATSYGVVDDTGLSVHAWLFSTNSPLAPGTVSPNVLGTLIGEEARLLGAWAIGSCNVVMPDTTGLLLPETGNLVVQWHHFNTTPDTQDDSSVFRVCTVPAGTRAQTAGITMLGTEYLDGSTGLDTFGGDCLNDSGEPVTILMIDPHMHRLGRRASMTVRRAAGGVAPILNVPFSFDERDHYLLEPAAVLEPGDALRTDCTFDTSSPSSLTFGQSALMEMCFQFAIATPPIALDNGVLSLVGATNTCW